MTTVLRRLGKAIEDIVFKNRMPIPKGLESSSLDFDDGTLCWKAYEHAEDSLYEAKGSYGSKVRFLPPQWRMVYTLVTLDCQVGNGGFHQFFTNAGGIYDSHLLSDVDTLGFDVLSKIMKEVWQEYSGIDYSDQWDNRGESWEHFAQGYKENRFDKQDSAYFEQSLLVQSFIEIIGAYIRKNWVNYSSAQDIEASIE